MVALSDADIKTALGRDIVIDPLAEEQISALGIDLTIGAAAVVGARGRSAMSRRGSDGDSADRLEIPPRASAIVVARERVWISHRLIGTLHSRGSLSGRGLVLNSTTVDPNWRGPMVFRLFNPTDVQIQLPFGERFVTLILHSAKTPTRASSKSEPITMLQELVPDASDRARLTDYIASESQRSFAEKVEQARARQHRLAWIGDLVASIPGSVTRAAKWVVSGGLIVATVLSVVALPAWGVVRRVLGWLGHDPGQLTAQAVFGCVALFVASLVALQNLHRKPA